MSKHFRGDEQPYIPPSFHDQDHDKPRRWSSNDVVEDPWKHRNKSPELRTLIACCLRKNLFVRETSGDHYTIMIRDKFTIPRTTFIESGTYDECLEFLDQYDPRLT